MFTRRNDYSELADVIIKPIDRRERLFRRLSLTVDSETMAWLGLDPATVTAAELRDKLKALAIGERQCPRTD